MPNENNTDNAGAPIAHNYISYDKALKLIHTFDGNSSMLHGFIDSVDFVFNRFDPGETDIFAFVVKAKLNDIALSHINTLEVSTWPEIKKELLKQFGEVLDIHSLSFEMTKLKQSLTEKPLEFVQRVEKHLLRIQKLIKYSENVSQCCKAVLNEYQSRSALITILSGLKEYLGQKIRIQNPQNILELRNYIVLSENQQFISKQINPILQSNTRFTTTNKTHNFNSNSGFKQEPQQKSPVKVFIKKCTFCGKLGHVEPECFVKQRQQTLRSASKVQIVTEPVEDDDNVVYVDEHELADVDVTDIIDNSFLELTHLQPAPPEIPRNALEKLSL